MKKARKDLLKLPFVSEKSFWDVKPTGDCLKDEETGSRYGMLALEYMRMDSRNSALLGWCIHGMPKGAITGMAQTADADNLRIEVSFLSFIAKAAMSSNVNPKEQYAEGQKRLSDFFASYGNEAPV